MARPPSPRADGHDRLRLPPASSPRRRKRQEKEASAGNPPGPPLPARIRKAIVAALARAPPYDAHTATDKSADSSIESAKVVLDRQAPRGSSPMIRLAITAQAFETMVFLRGRPPFQVSFESDAAQLSRL